MWIALAVISFAAGQVYLFRCLKKLDCYLEKHPMEPDEDGNSEESVIQ